MTASPVVLVHGAWHGAWCWNRVVDGLTERSVPTIAVDVPRPDPIGDGGEAYIRGVIDEIGEPTVLVGHSAGGVRITFAADGNPLVRHLVYLAAFMPSPTRDRSVQLSEIMSRPDSAGPHVEVVDGMMQFKTDSARTVFYHDCDETVANMATEKLVGEPIQQDLREDDGLSPAPWHSIPSTYVVCTDDRALPVDLQREMAAKAGAVVEFSTSHSPFLSRPELVVDLLARLARLS